MPKEKPMPPAPHEPPPHDPPREKPRRRRRRFPILLFLILLLLIVIVLLIYFKPFGGNGFGLSGNGGESGSQSSTGESVPGAESSSSSESTVAVIRIDGNDIYFDGEKCENVSALKEKITAVGTEKSYELDHSAAIKSTYDEVNQMLTELESALDIKINYNAAAN